jgi:hypothetical protein
MSAPYGPELPKNGFFYRMAERQSRTVLTSGGLEPVLDAGGGEHSVFARLFYAHYRTTIKLLTWIRFTKGFGGGWC